MYRLISKDTYEEQLFGTASRKYAPPLLILIDVAFSQYPWYHVFFMICRNIYVFLLRYGLDEAILGSTSTEDPEADVGRIARLLKHGAHSLVGAEENQQGEAFQSEDIDQVGGRGSGVDILRHLLYKKILYVAVHYPVHL